MVSNPLIRQAVRAVIVDRADRVLLVHFSFPDHELWAAPGGGIEPGETHAEALAREIREEVGELDVRGAIPVWTRTHLFQMPGWDGQYETYYLVRVDRLEPRPELDEAALRAEGVIGLAWWTLDELRASQSWFAPSRLPALVADLMTSGAPDEPIDVGV